MIGSKIADLLLNHFLPAQSMIIMVLNNMSKRQMINPMIYLKNGDSVQPPAFVIPPKQLENGAANLVTLESNKGMKGEFSKRFPH